MLATNNRQRSLITVPVLVAALGYFVDIYDLLLFSIIRITSLKGIGVTDPDALRNYGEKIISWQMYGLLLGGIIWGVVGDKKGRISVLFGSILLYSIANIANGFVHTVDQYAMVRFIAGLGLAGELGAGITLVSELTSKEKRGLATSLVAGLGLTGAILAYFIKLNFEWRTCYFIGGGLGIALLILRVSVFESGMFHEVKKMNVQRGNVLMLFATRERFKRYLFSILLGLPSWYVVGILMTFSNDFGKAMHIADTIDPAKAVMYSYVGVSIGGIVTGLVSQKLQSRLKTLQIFYGITALGILLFFTIQYNGTATTMYILAWLLGFGTGFWAMFVTVGAEQFGTNLRATAATTIPNMVRGTLPLIILLFQWLRGVTGSYTTGAWIAGIIVMAISIAASFGLKETFHRDMNFLEE
ncbi:MAG TPA: MFS transporter [Parafilimonas sp.]|nr:MFS transporter [Parafilimonas sp.]